MRRPQPTPEEIAQHFLPLLPSDTAAMLRAGQSCAICIQNIGRQMTYLAAVADLPDFELRWHGDMAILIPLPTT